MGDPRNLREVAQPLVAANDASLSMLCGASQHALSQPLQGRPPLRVLWGLMAAALALHLLFLDGLVGQAQPDRLVRAPALEVRSVGPMTPAMAPPAAPATTTATASTESALSQAAPQPAAKSPLTRVAPPQLAQASPAPAASPLTRPQSVSAEAQTLVPTREPAAFAPPASTAEVPLAMPPTDGDVPVYRTQLPPALNLRYALRRGARSGAAELSWQVGDGVYTLRLEARLGAAALLTQVSQGHIDDAGLAPIRFTDQRTRGGLRAANFQRDKNKITFSGPATEYRLLPGSQDRLSWMLQLASVVAAEPERMAPGGKVVLHVVGAGGHADVWVFRFVDFETMAMPDGPVRTAKFSRDARRLYDTEVDAWLDPMRFHLPVKQRWGSSPDGDAVELELQSVQAL